VGAFGVLAGAVLIGLLSGCATHSQSPNGQFDEKLVPSAASGTAMSGVTVTNQLDPQLLRPGNSLFTLGPGDSIEVEQIGTPTSRVVTRVGLDGKIYFSLLPGIDVWGLTIEQARVALEKELANYVRTPQVAITLRAIGSKHVSVLGRLNRPGIYPVEGSMTLLESIALAGGTQRSTSTTSTSEDLADLRHSFVVRQGQFLPVDFQRLLRDGDTSQNIVLQPDDFVYVPSSLANEVYVLGAVRLPRAVTFTENMSLVSAIAGADGAQRLNWLTAEDPGPFTKDAFVTHIGLVRGSLTQPQVMIVDYNAIVKGKAQDVRLEPGDIIYVPNTPLTTLKRYINLIVNTFVSTVAANEGVRAGGGEVGVGVSVPVGTSK
jgi:protein involved in polysaccharide export with SLBB domain